MYEKADFNIDSFPLFINNDGYMLLIADNRRIPRKPTEEEKRLYCKPKISRTNGNSVSSGASYTSSSTKNEGKISNMKFDNKKFREKEKALKITVKKNENFEIKENNNIIIDNIYDMKSVKGNGFDINLNKNLNKESETEFYIQENKEINEENKKNKN